MESKCNGCGQDMAMEVEMWCEQCEVVLCQGCAQEHKAEGHDVTPLKD